MTVLNDLRLKAISGDAESEYQLGMMYWLGRYIDGEFVGPNMIEGHFLIRSAAAKGYKEAIQFLNKKKWVLRGLLRNPVQYV